MIYTSSHIELQFQNKYTWSDCGAGKLAQLKLAYVMLKRISTRLVPVTHKKYSKILCIYYNIYNHKIIKEKILLSFFRVPIM